MPLKREVKLDLQWPHLCPKGRQLAYAREQAQDYVEVAKGAKRVREAAEAKQGAEDDLFAHMAQCGRCYDRAAEATQRLRARALRARRVRVPREGGTVARSGVATRELGASAPFDPRRPDGSPEAELVVQFALWRLEATVINKEPPAQAEGSTAKDKETTREDLAEGPMRARVPRRRPSALPRLARDRPPRPSDR